MNFAALPKLRSSASVILCKRARSSSRLMPSWMAIPERLDTIGSKVGGKRGSRIPRLRCALLARRVCGSRTRTARDTHVVCFHVERGNPREHFECVEARTEEASEELTEDPGGDHSPGWQTGKREAENERRG